jgi:hypothetical protein
MEKKLTRRSATTVKIPDDAYSDFKVMAVKTSLNLQELVERSMFLYLTDSNYRYKIHQTIQTSYTGSDLINSIGK